ncbi:MAG: hypothetical protein UW79_C0006G0031, partial [Candidatus Yanofskybacteria bacterium GW2011_GWA2_44_9]
EAQVRKYIEWQDKKEVPQTVRIIRASKQKRFELTRSGHGIDFC